MGNPKFRLNRNRIRTAGAHVKCAPAVLIPTTFNYPPPPPRERTFAVESHPEARHVSAASNANVTNVEPSRHQPESIFKADPLTNMSRYLNPKNDLAFKTVFGG
ncbi:MAG: hypothetical protein LBK99_09650, partial [Opitutaceae bacterium]|nr:hypothetical protein [Opitutaceae bacterium]